MTIPFACGCPGANLLGFHLPSCRFHMDRARMNIYEQSAVAAERYFATHTPAEVVARLREVAPYAFQEPAMSYPSQIGHTDKVGFIACCGYMVYQAWRTASGFTLPSWFNLTAEVRDPYLSEAKVLWNDGDESHDGIRRRARGHGMNQTEAQVFLDAMIVMKKLLEDCE